MEQNLHIVGVWVLRVGWEREVLCFVWDFWGWGAVEGNVHVKQRYLLLILGKDNDDILILLNQTAEYFFEG